MRRMVSVILTVAFMLGAFAASAEGTGALDAFAALTGQQAQINDPGKDQRRVPCGYHGGRLRCKARGYHGSRRDGPRVAVSFGYQHA